MPVLCVLRSREKTPQGSYEYFLIGTDGSMCSFGICWFEGRFFACFDAGIVFISSQTICKPRAPKRMNDDEGLL